MNDEEPVRHIYYLGSPGTIREHYIAPEWVGFKRVGAYDSLLGIDDCKGGIHLITAPVAGLLEWLAPIGLVLRGQAVARIRGGIPPAVERVTTWNWRKEYAQPTHTPRATYTLPTVCPYQIRGIPHPKQYKLDRADVEEWERLAEHLKTNGSDLLRLAMRSFQALPRGEIEKWWENVNQDIRQAG